MTDAPNNDHARTSAESAEHGGIGEQLRRARDKRGLSVDELARSLKLESRIIEKLESEAFDELPPPAFVRGYLRAIAKEFGMDSTALLERFELHGHAEPPELADFKSRAPMQITSESTVIRYTTAALCLAMIILVALWWRSHGDDDLDLGRLEATGESLPEPAATLPLPYEFQVVEHPDVPTYNAPAPEPVPAPETGSADESQAPAQAATEAPVAGMNAAEPVPGETVATEEGSDDAELVIRASEDAWVDVADGSGRRLYFDLARPGREIRLSGEPPYTLVIGNSGSVEVLFRGEPVATARYAHEGVARFELGR
ncbi:MAG: RodZ domain-containing protein [Dehalococcoidia bacterium]